MKKQNSMIKAFVFEIHYQIFIKEIHHWLIRTI